MIRRAASPSALPASTLPALCAQASWHSPLPENSPASHRPRPHRRWQLAEDTVEVSGSVPKRLHGTLCRAASQAPENASLSHSLSP